MKKKRIILMNIVVFLGVFLFFIFIYTQVRENVQENITEDDGTVLIGTWTDGINDEYRFYNGNWESWHEGNLGIRGIYTAENGIIVLTLTGISFEEEWIDYPEESQTGTYSVNENILTLTFNEESRTFTKK